MSTKKWLFLYRTYIYIGEKWKMEMTWQLFHLDEEMLDFNFTY